MLQPTRLVANSSAVQQKAPVLLLLCSFPGTVAAKVVYTIPAAGRSLSINMSATSDKPTPISIINHAYFNLKGAGNGDILDHWLQLSAHYYTPAAEGQLVPSGEVAAVAGGPYDFTRAKPIRQDLMRANGGGTR
jgi:aldose 1-epimerase